MHGDGRQHRGAEGTGGHLSHDRWTEGVCTVDWDKEELTNVPSTAQMHSGYVGNHAV